MKLVFRRDSHSSQYLLPVMHFKSYRCMFATNIFSCLRANAIFIHNHLIVLLSQKTSKVTSILPLFQRTTLPLLWRLSHFLLHQGDYFALFLASTFHYKPLWVPSSLSKDFSLIVHVCLNSHYSFSPPILLLCCLYFFFLFV